MENKLRYCGRDFFESGIEKIRDIISSDDKPNRAEISRPVYREFSWVKHEI
jgi:hypothetical protein